MLTYFWYAQYAYYGYRYSWILRYAVSTGTYIYQLLPTIRLASDDLVDIADEEWVVMDIGRRGRVRLRLEAEATDDVFGQVRDDQVRDDHDQARDDHDQSD